MEREKDGKRGREGERVREIVKEGWRERERVREIVKEGWRERER